jgi:hypothetical protein
MTTPNNFYSIPDGKVAAIAEYADQPLVEYRENPLIEALPPILSKEDFVETVCEYPAFDGSERDLPPAVRLHCVERLMRFFQPLERHIDLEQKISRLIRQGYLARNPLAPSYAVRLKQLNQSVREARAEKVLSFEKHVSAPRRRPGSRSSGSPVSASRRRSAASSACTRRSSCTPNTEARRSAFSS